MSFWGELKRRNVFKVGAAYAIVAWLLAQIANTFFPVLHLPEWTVTLVVALLILGFPLALLFAWAFELTPEGIKKTEHVPMEESITHLTGKKLNYIVTSLLMVAVAYIIVDNYYLDRRVIETEVASRVAEIALPTTDEKETTKTIAVLPFSDLSPDKDQEYFVDGLSEELLNCLSKINGLKVTSRTSSFAFKNTEKTLQEVASVLGVDHILEGSVRKAGDELRITAQLIRVEDDSNLWSETYNRELKDIFNLQEDIATAVAKELRVKLGIAGHIRQLGGTDNAKAYEYYLTSKGLIGQGSSYDFTSVALEEELIDSAIDIDPGFALAWVRKAAIHNYYELIKPVSLAGAERAIALQSIHRAIDLEPDLAIAHHYLGSIKTGGGDFIGGELSIKKAFELSEPTSEGSISAFYHYWPVGHLKKAHEIIETCRLLDPLYPNNRQHYIASLAFLGETQKAEEEYKRIRILVGENQKDNMAITLARLGTKDILSPDDIIYSGTIFDVAKKNIDSPQEGLTELRRLYANDNINLYDLNFIAMWAAYFGDSEFAINVIGKAAKSNTSGMTILWWPIMRDVRRLPRFKELVREIGLVDYWKQFGWPDLCHPTDDDFECD